MDAGTYANNGTGADSDTLTSITLRPTLTLHQHCRKTSTLSQRINVVAMHQHCRNTGAPVDPHKGMRFVRRIPVFQNGVDTDDDWVLFVHPNV